jgi:filamentous hemagglutinin
VSGTRLATDELLEHEAGIAPPLGRPMADNRSPHQHALPNYENAVIPREKLELYCLDPGHVSLVFGKSSGKDKARVFQAALGFVTSDWELLRNRILEELPYQQALMRHEDEHGKRYNVSVPITGPNGRTVTVLTAWIIRPNTDYPSFVTALCLGGA